MAAGRRAGRGWAAYLVVFAVGVAATAVGQDAALAVEDVASIALAALHAVVVALTLEADGGAARLADTHAALVVAVGRAGDGWNTRHMSGLRRSQGLYTVLSSTRGDRGLAGVELCHLFSLRLPLLLESLHLTHYFLNDGPQS